MTRNNGPDRDLQADLFLPQITALPIRDQRDTMERPFFSLHKRKRTKPIDYTSPDGKVSVHVTGNSEYGIATIYDLDILIYCASVLMEHKRRGVNDIPQTLGVIPYDMLKTLRRDTGGGEYEGLANALNRLQSTTVKTNIRTTGRREHTFSWIDSYSQVVDANGKIRGMRITLAKWFYDGVLMDGGVLTIDPKYFEIKGGVMRWLYRVARKHAGGNGADGFTISMPTLYEKSGSESPYRRFKFEMIKLARENALPGFSLDIIEHAAKEPSLKMVRRASIGQDMGEEGAIPPARKPSSRSKTVIHPTQVPFPASGHIGYTPFGPIAQAALPYPQRDLGLVAEDFRRFLADKNIPTDAMNIEKIFSTFCSKQNAAS